MNRLIAVIVLALAATGFSVGPVRSAVLSLHAPLTPQEEAARLWWLATPESAQRLFPSEATTSKPPFATGFNAVPARSAASSLHAPLTPQEQAARLWWLAKPEAAQRLFPPGEIESRHYKQLDYRRAYAGALPHDRAVIAERVGEQGSARFAAERGWTMLLGPGDRGIRQGPDSVYWDRQARVVRVLEAKGGTAAPTSYFGFSQDTNQYSIRSAQHVLESPAATQQARVAAAHVIVAAQKDRLVTGVVRTTHVEGTPDEPRLATRWDRTDVRAEARAIERAAIQGNSAARQAFREARREQFVAMLPHRVAQSVAVLGLGGAAGLGWETTQQFRIAWSMLDDPSLQGTLLPHAQTLIVIGLGSQAAALGVSSAAQMGAIKLLGSAGLAQFAGAVFLPVTFGVEGLRLTTALYEYRLGRIGELELYRRATGTAIVGVMTAGGAIVGGLIGLPAGGVGALPAAAIGTKIGFLMAIPIQFAADVLWEWYYRDFRADQRQRVDEALYRRYGLQAL